MTPFAQDLPAQRPNHQWCGHPSADPSCDIEHREDPELRALPRVGNASLDCQKDSAESMLQGAQESLVSTKISGARLTSSDRAAWVGEPS